MLRASASPQYRRFLPIAFTTVTIAAVAGVAWYRQANLSSNHRASSPATSEVSAEDHAAAPTDSARIQFPQESWSAANLKIEPAQVAPFTQMLELTGKISLNEDRVAHIFPLVQGRVEEVKIRLGDKVKEGDLLVVVQSREVGQSLLQLFEDRLKRDFAVRMDKWTQTVTANTQAMLTLMRTDVSIEDIEKQLTDRPMGEYRDKLMTAYVAYYKARKNLERLAPLSSGGAVAGKQLLEAEAEWNASRATLQSLLEQLQQEVQQAASASNQSVKELDTRVAVDETNLKILGFTGKSLAAIDPVKQGEAISHYPIQSPFDGTIISKDVVLLERVSPEHQILSIADLSTVWVNTDIYEEHLSVLRQLEGGTVEVRSSVWPDRTFKADVFYTGDLVDESSRTLSLRAVADNSEGLLKPGMFVNVVLPSVARDDVLQVPPQALQEHEGKTFVFVHVGGDWFERRDVEVGVRSAQAVEVVKGLSPDEKVVTSGGFALKSQMLSELLSGD